MLLPLMCETRRRVSVAVPLAVTGAAAVVIAAAPFISGILAAAIAGASVTAGVLLFVIAREMVMNGVRLWRPESAAQAVLIPERRAIAGRPVAAISARPPVAITGLVIREEVPVEW